MKTELKIRLSHTAKEKYLNCPLSYYMHYTLGLREKVVGSALPFGTAIDEANGALLEGKTLKESLQVFEEYWTSPVINNKKVELRKYKNIRYSKADHQLDEDPWISMLRKAELMLGAYQSEFMPMVKDVLCVQKNIKIKNNLGDYITGFLDTKVELTDGRTVTIDNKTSSQAYKKDAVLTPEKGSQLALYCHAEDCEYGGFVIQEKNIRKREPRARVQILIDKPPETLVKKTLDEFQDVLYNIKMGVFPSNHPHCNRYYGKCICDKYYPSGGENLAGLIKVKK